MTDGNAVTAEIDLQLVVDGHGGVPLTADVSYRVSDPYAIEMALDTGQGAPVRWLFARDLLADGLHGHTGDGDVRIWPSTGSDPDLLNICLSSPDGQAHLQAPLAVVTSFLYRTFDAVGRGHEHGYINIQDELDNLLHSG